MSDRDLGPPGGLGGSPAGPPVGSAPSGRSPPRARPDGRRPDRQSIPAAALAALAEAGIIFLPLRQLLFEETRASEGPLSNPVAFVLLFVGAVAAGTALRHSGAFPPLVAVGAIVLGVLQATAWGAADAWGALFVVILALLVGLRVLTLSFRDWQDPIADSFVIGVVVLLLEVVSSSSFASSWAALLPLVVPVFFLASLGSRAASVRLVTRPASKEADQGTARRVKLALIGLAVFGGILAASAALGAKGGVFQLVGRLIYLLIQVLLTVVALLVARVILPPLAWLFGTLHINLNGIRRAAERLFGQGGPQGVHLPTSTPLWIRLLGFLAMAIVALLLVAAMRRRWRELLLPERRPPQPKEPPAVRLRPMTRLRSRSARIPRWEPPADTIRRWYGEALLALSRRGMEKPPSRTPAEFLPQVVRAFPECAGGFTELTRSYEDVRYGNRAIDRSTLLHLIPERDALMETFRKARRSDDGGQPMA